MPEKVYTRRSFIRQIAGGAAGLFLAGLPAFGDDPPARPNILLAIADDLSYPHTSAYGCTFVNTPGFDWVAANGVLMQNAYCPAPSCSPSRASLLTGRNIWQNEEASGLRSYFPKKWPVYTELLEQAGYLVGWTGKGWGPGELGAGWTKNPAGTAYNSKSNSHPTGISGNNYAENFNDFLNVRQPGQPFCFWYGGLEPHRIYQLNIGVDNGKNPADVNVPPYLPDNDTIRKDMLDYAYEIEWFDSHLQRMLDKLADIGELDNTLIVVTGDNGMPFPRAKTNLYPAGTQVPMAVCWPNQVLGSRTITDFVSFSDLAPTFLEAAGLPIPVQMVGKSILPVLTSSAGGRVDPERNFVVCGRERHTHARINNVGYPARSIQTDEYLYIRNFAPERWPMGHEFADVDDSPSKSYVLNNQSDPAVQPKYELGFAKRPADELYDINSDPHCLNNIADDPAYAQIKQQLWKKLKDILVKQKDPRVLGRGDIFESYPRFGPMQSYPGFNAQGQYNPKYTE